MRDHQDVWQGSRLGKASEKEPSRPRDQHQQGPEASVSWGVAGVEVNKGGEHCF